MWTSHDYSKCITYNFLFIAFINIIFLKMLVNFSTDMLFLNYNCTCLKWCTVYIISNIWFMYSLINFFTAICTWLKPAVGQWILLMFINFTHNDVIFQFVIFFKCLQIHCFHYYFVCLQVPLELIYLVFVIFDCC